MSKCLSDRVLVVSDTGSHAALLALRYGDMQTVNYAFDKIMVNMERAVLEPNQAPEAFTKTVLPCSHWPYLLGKGKEMAGLLSLLRMDWQSAEATCDLATADTDKNVWFAPRGQSNSAYFFVNMDYMCWSAKLNYALCAPDGAVPREDVVRALTSLTPELLSEYSLQSKGLEGSSDSSLAMISMGFSAHLIAALCAEKYGQLDQALAFVTVIHEVDPVRGSDHKPSAHILGNCVKGRVLQQRGQTAEAAAAFEAAVAQGEAVGMPLLVAFALRDLKLHILDGMGHGDHGSRRLGAVLRRLKDPAEMFTPLLSGLDAASLMAMGDPERGYEVVFETEDPTTAALRTELSALKLKALKKRAREEGVSEELLEDADDADDVRSAVVQLILETASGTADNEHTARQVLESELAQLKLKALKKRARSSGVDADKLDDADDADNVKSAVIELIVLAEVSSTPSDDRPHFGTQRTPEPQPEPEPQSIIDHAELMAMAPPVANYRVAFETEDAALGALREELQALRVTALQRRAESQGVDEAQVDDAMDSDQPRARLVALLLEHEASTTGARASTTDKRRQQLRRELEALGLFALQQRGRQAGLDDASLEAALDSASPKEALIEHIVGREAAGSL